MKLKAMVSTSLLTLLGISSGAWAGCPGILSLPTASAANSVTFFDGISYSLPILGINIGSSPGQIDDCIVVTTGSGGTNINQNFAGMDNAFQNGSTPYFRTGDPVNSPDPGQVGLPFTGQTDHTWDTQISALKTYLAGNDMVVYFNHNQVNSGASTNQDIFIWAQIKLVDTDPTNLAAKYFYVAATPAAFPGATNFGTPGGNPTTFTGPQADPSCTYPTAAPGGSPCPNGIAGSPTLTTDANYMVRALGQICLNGAVGVGTPVPCSGPHVAEVNDNLGANQFANAIVFPEINAILASAGAGGYDVLQVDLRMGCNSAVLGQACPVGSVMNNGFEQVVIGKLNPQLVINPGCFLPNGDPCQPAVPEPDTTALLGLGLLGLTLARKRRRA